MPPEYMSKEEWREVVREVRPDITDEQYEIMWQDFIFNRELWRRRN